MSRPRVVVLGNGMAGSRVVEEIRRHDPARLVKLTVVGSESHTAYNRILLSEVLAGRHQAADIALNVDGWHVDNDVALRCGSPGIRIDRRAQLVETQDGATYSYDALVLSTGSRPLIPPVDGLMSADTVSVDTVSAGHGFVKGAFVFRTLDDCRAIEAAATTASRAVVLGGGLLGIEAARGLAGRGLPVVLVHLAGHLMERQLDPAAGRVLAKTLAELGVTVRLGACAQSVIHDASGAFGGLSLGDGSCVLGDLLVVATGVRPEVDLARAAGLDVDVAVVVDDNMRSVSDPRIYAVGECAQHRGTVYGLVAPAWEQASVVANQLTGADPASQYRGSRIVTRLKASGVDLASLGDPHADDEDLDVVQVADPGRGTYAKVMLRDERIVGAILLGQVAGIGTLTTLFDRDAQLPHDRLSLLLPVDAAASSVTRVSSPSAMPGSAIVCLCNGVTKATIQSRVLAGSRTVKAVATQTRATTGCGGCLDTVTGIVDWLNASEPAQPFTPAQSLGKISAVTVAELPELEEVS